MKVLVFHRLAVTVDILSFRVLFSHTFIAEELWQDVYNRICLEGLFCDFFNLVDPSWWKSSSWPSAFHFPSTISLSGLSSFRRVMSPKYPRIYQNLVLKDRRKECYVHIFAWDYSPLCNIWVPGCLFCIILYTRGNYYHIYILYSLLLNVWYRDDWLKAQLYIVLTPLITQWVGKHI